MASDSQRTERLGVNSACARFLRQQGKPAPRTCQACGLGPCRNVLAESQSSRDQTTALPTEWLGKVAGILYDMMGEGLCIIGRPDPECLLDELADYLGTRDSDDPWVDAVKRLGGAVEEDQTNG